jgi:hypothetical protein
LPNYDELLGEEIVVDTEGKPIDNGIQLPPGTTLESTIDGRSFIS